MFTVKGVLGLTGAPPLSCRVIVKIPYWLESVPGLVAVDVAATIVTVVPVTTRARGIPVEVALGRDEGLPKHCVANADTVTTIPKDALADYAGVLAPEKLQALDAAVRFALGLD